MKKRLLKFLLVSGLFMTALLSPLIPSNHAFAAMSDPTAVLLHDFAVFRHLLEADDYLAIGRYDITYPSTPSVNIDRAFIFQFYDGGDLLGSIQAYPYPSTTGGYPDGIISFYFSAADAPTWNTAYTIRLTENPSQFDSPTFWDFTLPISAYTTATTTATNRAELTSLLRDIADDLAISWGVDLLTQTEEGIVLSDDGEGYFRNSILGLQTMCPDLFSVQIETPDTSTRSWTYTLADSMATRYSGTFIGDAMTGFAGLFTMDTSPAWNVASIILFAALICWELSFKTKRTRLSGVTTLRANGMSALMDGFALLVLMTLHGFMNFVLCGLIAFLVGGVMPGIVLFLNRA